MATNPFLRELQRIVVRVAQEGIRTFLSRQTESARQAERQGRPGAGVRGAERQPSGASASEYPGDYRGMPLVTYAPQRGDRPDPGEVVWTWVPYEEDHSRGKDRPVLLIGRDGAWLLGLQLTSKDHDFDEAQEARAGRFWVDIGPGGWDRQGRPSEVRVNRVVRIDPDAVRRISVSLPKDRFDLVVAGMRRHLR